MLRAAMMTRASRSIAFTTMLITLLLCLPYLVIQPYVVRISLYAATDVSLSLPLVVIGTC